MAPLILPLPCHPGPQRPGHQLLVHSVWSLSQDHLNLFEIVQSSARQSKTQNKGYACQEEHEPGLMPRGITTSFLVDTGLLKYSGNRDSNHVEFRGERVPFIVANEKKSTNQIRSSRWNRLAAVS